MPTADTIAHDTLAQPFYMLHDAWPVPDGGETNTGIPLDSIFQPWQAQDTVLRQTLFTGHTLAPQHTTLQTRPTTVAPPWLFVVLVMLIAALCIYVHSNNLKIAKLFRSLFEGHTTQHNQHGLMQGVALPPIAPLLCISVATTIWWVAMRSTGVLGFALLALGLTLAYLLRNAVLNVLANAFDQRETMAAYIGTNYIYHLLLAIVLAPMQLLMAYTPWGSMAVAYVIFGLMALTFLLRFIRGAGMFFSTSKDFCFFLFYYLCSVELLPFLVALKWIISQ